MSSFEHSSFIFLPLQGPTGVRPKAPAVGAWQSPGYKGIGYTEARNRHFATPDRSEWFGLRCDHLVVVDCDCKEAAERWRSIQGDKDTCIRQTPRGFHFIYTKTPGSPDWPSADVFGNESHIDIRAGRTSQIVYFAPGYRNLTANVPIDFDPAWLPEGYVDRTPNTSRPGYEDESWDEIPEGRGNNTMAAFAGAFRKQGMSLVPMVKCLSAINRIVMTNDPMPTEMIVEIAKSVGRYAPRPDIDIEIEDD